MYRIPAATIWADMIRTGLAGLLPLFGTAATTATTTTPALSVQLLGARSRSLPSVSSFSSSTFSFSFHLRGISRAFPNCAPASRFLSSSNPAAPSHHHHHHYLFSKARRRAHHGHDRDHDDHDHDHDHGHNLHLSSLLPFFRQNLSQMPADEGILSAIPDNAQKRPGKADLSKKKQKAAAAAAVAAVERQENNGCGEVVEVEEEEGGDEAAEAPRKDAWCLNKAKKLKLKEGQVQELLGQENSGCYEGGVVVAEVPRKDACPPPPQQQPPHPSAPGAEDSNINSVNNKAAVTGTKKRPHQDSQHHTPKKQKTKVPVVQETQSQSQSQPQSQPHPVLDTEEPPNSSAEVVIVEKGQETPAEDCNGTATTTTAPAPTPTAATQPYPSPGTEYPSSPPEIAEKIAAVKTFSLLVKKLSDKGRAPTRGSALAAGYDMYSAGETIIPKRGKALIPTGISIAVPPGTYGRVAPRSGLASKNFIDVGAGVIDEDYRGEVKILLFNHSDIDFKVKEGDRVAQLILERIYTPEAVVVDELPISERGESGFGSTGV